LVTPVSAQPRHSGGGAGSAGRIGRGIDLAVGSIRILFGNLRLLWFSVLTGIVMSLSIAAYFCLEYLSGKNPLPGMAGSTGSPQILVATGSPGWFVLTFMIALISTFLTYFFLAGLIACVSSLLSEKPLTVREGLSLAKNHIRPLLGWTAVGALLGTASNYITNSWTAGLAVTLLSMGVVFLFFVLTIFVVPAIVLDNRNVLTAVRESLSVFRKTWGEIVACFVLFLAIVFVLYLVALVPVFFIGFSVGNAALAGFAVILTMLVMMVLIFIGSTVTGIATLGLYLYGTTGRIPLAYEEKTNMKAPE